VKNAIYGSSLTDAHWDYLYPMLPKPSKRGRPPTDRRRILDAILQVVKRGVRWRYLPTDFPPWKTVFRVFRKRTLNHQWEALNDALRILVRKTHDKRSQLRLLA
jgi:transposase